MLKTSEPEPDILTKEEQKLFEKHLPRTNIRLVYYIMKYAGLRRSECMRFCIKDIDMNTGFIHLPQTKNYTQDSVPIHPKLYHIFKWISIYEKDPDEKLFPYSKWWISQAFRKTLD